MAIKYLSEHHSPEDPGGLIRSVLDMGADFPGPAEDIVMSWLMRLDDALDPAEAAACLLERYGITEAPAPDGACGRVVALLRQTADNKAADLMTHHTRRRGGRRGRK